MDPHHVYRPLLDLIARAEGTARGRGYDETLAYGRLTGGPVELTRYTLDRVEALQKKMLAHPENRWNSSACGRYQIVRKTLRDIRQRLGLRGSDLFDAAMQDRMACFLLGRRGIDRYLAGAIGENELFDALALEWASLPAANGNGRHAGQKPQVSRAELRVALAELVRRARRKPPPRSGPEWLRMLFERLLAFCRGRAGQGQKAGLHEKDSASARAIDL